MINDAVSHIFAAAGTLALMTIYPINLNVMHSIPPSASVLSVRRYALQEGISPQAAHKRIKSGHLNAAIIRNGRRIWIDPHLAAIEWAKRSKPCNSRAAQLEQYLMATAPILAAEVSGQSPEYCRAALWRWVDQAINQTG